MNNYSAEIAVNRFGMGARAGELKFAQENPVNWLLKQIQPIKFDPAIGSIEKATAMFRENAALRIKEKQVAASNTAKRAEAVMAEKPMSEQYMTENSMTEKPMTEMSMNEMGSTKVSAANTDTEQQSPEIKAYRKQSSEMITAMQLEVLRNAITTPNSVSARLLDFFSNHFSVSGQGVAMRLFAPLLEREAIAPYLAGTFTDMLLAVEQHPAMLIYLNNEKSIGPDSLQGKKSKKGLNENLGREILELHTLGVHGGYGQADVRELAMAITGWSVAGPKEDATGFVFRKRMHQPGARTVLNKTYSQEDVAQGEAILKDLAIHPATAQHMSFKLVRHFVADQPPEKLVAAMKKTWLSSKGDIPAVMKTLFEHPDTWNPEQQKYKTPREFIISSLRVVDSLEPINLDKAKLLQGLRSLGQEPFNAGSPAGYGDVAMSWNGAEALMARIEWANQFAAHIKSQPMDFIAAALGNQLSEYSLKLIKRAESRQQGLAMALMAPEFQRR